MPTAPTSVPTKYLLHAVDDKGRRVTEEVSAATPQKAVRTLSSRGWTGVTLVTDDSMNTFVPSATGERSTDIYSPKDRARMLKGNRWVQSLISIKFIYLMTWKALLIPLALLLVRRFLHEPWGILDLLLGVLLVGPILIQACMRGPTTTLRKIEKAYLWSRWEDMLDLCDHLEHQCRNYPNSALMVARWRSKALMRLGRTNEALVLLNGLRLLGVPELSIQMTTGLAYQAASQLDGAIACFRRMTELAPNEWLGWVLLAELYASSLEQPAPAREALSHVDRTALAVESLRAVQSAEAGIALCEGRYAEAAKGFENTISYCREKVSSSPMAQLGVAWFQALHAMACIRCGRTNDAISSYNAAVPWLERASSTRALERLHKAMGQYAR